MSLPEFIGRHRDEIIQEFAAFAKTLMPPATEMTDAELRDHADEILTAVAKDMHVRQTPEEPHRKSQGRGSARSMKSSGKLHAVDRIGHGYTFQAVLAEFRALRASVLRLYEESGATDLGDVRRFNEAIDEALTESIGQYAHHMAGAETALLASEEKYRTLFDTMGRGYARCEVVRDGAGRAVDIRLLELNPAYERLLGVPMEVARGGLVYELYPDVDRWWLENYDRVVRTGTPELLEYRYTAVDRWFEARVYPRGHDQFVALFEDITDRKRAEARQAFLLELSDTLRAERDAEVIGQLAVDLLARHMGVDRCYVTRASRAQGIGWLGPEHYAPDLAPIAGEYRDADFPESMRRLEAEPLIIRDLWTDPTLSDLDKRSLASMGVQALIVGALRDKREFVWGMAVGDRSPRAWTDADRILVEETAERTWAAIERARAEAALTASEAEYRTLFENMGQGYCDLELVRDAQGRAVDQRYLALNPALERIFGIPLAWARGRTANEVFGDVAPWWNDAYDRVARSGTPAHIEHEEPSLGCWLEVHVYPRGGDRLTVLYEDITERKRAEAARRESEARQAFLLTLSDALRAESDVEAVGRRAVEMIAKQLGADRVYLVTLNPDDDRVVVTHETRQTDLPPLRGEYRSTTFPSAIREIFERTIVYEDVRTDPRLTDHDRAAFTGLDAVGFIAASIRKGTHTMIWAAGAVSTRPRSWTPTEIALFEDAVERTWAAIERARAEAAVHEAYELLEQRVRERTSQVQSLFQRLVSAQEEERRRIARDIHDQLGQQMTALRMNIEAWRSRSNDGPALLEHADRTQRLAEELDQSIDFLTWQLRPAALDHLGLSAALRNLVTGWSERFGVQADFDVAGVEDVRLRRDVEANLYRIAQEALHNITKHAGATHVTVYLTSEGGNILLLIEDDGRGFDPTSAREPEINRGLGLINIQERAALVAGRLEIDSRANHGTSIYVRIPESGRSDGER